MTSAPSNALLGILQQLSSQPELVSQLDSLLRVLQSNPPSAPVATSSAPSSHRRSNPMADYEKLALETQLDTMKKQVHSLRLELQEEREARLQEKIKHEELLSSMRWSQQTENVTSKYEKAVHPKHDAISSGSRLDSSSYPVQLERKIEDSERKNSTVQPTVSEAVAVSKLAHQTMPSLKQEGKLDEQAKERKMEELSRVAHSVSAMRRALQQSREQDEKSGRQATSPGPLTFSRSQTKGDSSVPSHSIQKTSTSPLPSTSTSLLPMLYSGFGGEGKQRPPVTSPLDIASRRMAERVGRPGKKRLTPLSPARTYADQVGGESSAPTASAMSMAATDGGHPLGRQAEAVAVNAGPSSFYATSTRSAPVIPMKAVRKQDQPSPPPIAEVHKSNPAVEEKTHVHAATRSYSSVSTGATALSGPTRSPSPLNPQRGPQHRRNFIFTGLKAAEVKELEDHIAALGGDSSVVSCGFDCPPPPIVTHVVLRGTPCSVKALCCLVSGRWLVSPDYIVRSAAAGFWLDEEKEGGKLVSPPPLRYQRFLVTEKDAIIREKLEMVIKYGDGEVIATQPSEVPGGKRERDVVVIASGDDLLQYIQDTY